MAIGVWGVVCIVQLIVWATSDEDEAFTFLLVILRKGFAYAVCCACDEDGFHEYSHVKRSQVKILKTCDFQTCDLRLLGL